MKKPRGRVNVPKGESVEFLPGDSRKFKAATKRMMNSPNAEFRAVIWNMMRLRASAFKRLEAMQKLDAAALPSIKPAKPARPTKGRKAKR